MLRRAVEIEAAHLNSQKEGCASFDKHVQLKRNEFKKVGVLVRCNTMMPLDCTHKLLCIQVSIESVLL